MLEQLVEKYGKEGWEQVYDMAVRLCQQSCEFARKTSTLTTTSIS